MVDAWEFLLSERGLTEETLGAFGVDREGDSVVFPYPLGRKYRAHKGEERKFWSEPSGVALGLLAGPDAGDTGRAFLVEGETDAMRLWQEFKGMEHIIGLPGVNTWRPEYAQDFNSFDTVYVILDNDPDYKVASTVDKCWREIRNALGKKARRIILPDGINDLCEFFDVYDLDTLRMLSERQVHSWHYEAMDLTQTPLPPDWLVNELICKGDISLMIGEPGVGKSWLSMSLAVAVAEGQGTWLGRKVDPGNNRVLYVDEENPEPLIPYRLKRLGLSDSGASNIRYLHRQGVRLDRHPERILDEALDWEPTLIVLDSLTRLHTKDENNAGEVASLFNDGIVPLARESGATTLILHHVIKGESNSSFARARGSGDLSASIDSGLDIRASDTTGGLYIAHYKSRWIAEGQTIRASIQDTPSGDVRVLVNEKMAF